MSDRAAPHGASEQPQMPRPRARPPHRTFGWNPPPRDEDPDGWAAAWVALVSAFDDELRARARRRAREAPDVAGDAVDATWARAFLKLDQLRTPGAVAGWLRTTLDREVIKLLRQRKRRLTQEVALGGVVRAAGARDATLEVPDPTPTWLDVEADADLAAAREADGAQCNARVQAWIRDLPLTDQELVRRHVLDGVSYADIARQRGQSYDAVAKRGRRLLERARRECQASPPRPT